MAKILSQEEVDSLLSGIGEGKVETETDLPERYEKSVSGYDFRKEKGPVHLSMPGLGAINDRFAGFLKTSLSSATGAIINASISDTESVKFNEFCRSLPLPTSINIFKMEPLRGFALLVLEGPLVFAFVDSFLGGNCIRQVKVESKSFTPMETKIIERIVRIILGEWQQGWADVHEVKVVFSRSETDPIFSGIAMPEEMVIVTRFAIDIASFTGVMTICFPYSTLEPVKDKLKESHKNEEPEADPEWRRSIEEKIKEVSMNLSCTLGTAKINGRDLLHLKVDDVIRLDQKATDPIILSLLGIPKFTGHLGAVDQKKAIRIEGRVIRG